MKKLYKLLLICLLIIAGDGNALKAQSYNSDNSETANRAETPTYISKIAVAYGAKESTPKDILKYNGFTIIDKDLNDDCGAGSHYIYMGYKTTTNPADAITGIFFRTGNNPPNSATFDGVTAYLLGGSNETNPGENTYVDLNADAGGQYIYTYVTRNTSRAAVINGMYFDGSNSASGYVTPNVNLNSGTSGGAIYLHYKQFSGKASATFHYLNSSGSRTSSTTSVSVKHHQQAVNNTPSAPTSVTYDGRTWTLLGWREDNNATTAGSNPSYTYMDSKVYRAVYSADVSLTYNANGGSNAPSKQTAKQYVNAGSSSIAKSNTSFTIPSTTPTHDATKCNFAGWSTSSSSTTAQYQAGGSISINTNTTLYAVWPEHNGTKTYVNNGSNHTYTWSCCEKSVTEDHIYDNGIDNYCGAHIHEIDGNGYCHLCDGYPAELVNGYYEIYNADNLFWFAEYVNTIDRTASAKLMNDIDLENRPWTPIGTTGETSHNFRGHFDGNGKTITGLNVTVTRNGGGFFGEVRLGTVEDFTIYGEVKLNGKHSYVGGVIGSAPGANSNQPEHNGATIRNITSYVNVTLGEGSHGSNHVAGFIGYANHETLIENCTWYGTLDLDAYRAQDGVGGLVGKANDNSEITIRNCAAYGTIKTSYQSGSYNSHNSIYIGGIVSNSVSSAQTTLENCIWAGTLVNNTDLDSNAHISAIGTLNGIKSVSNCYALNNMPYITTNDEHNTGITEVTAEQLASGEIAYKLQGTQATQIWGQNIDNGETADSKPILGGAKVYGIIYDGGGIYSNTNITAGGKCGDNLYWTVSNNTLTIFGTGAMYDYGSTSNKAPWRSLNPAPTSLVLEEGISHIGNSAFRECYRFTGSLTIPNSVTTIGDDAFYKCSGFKEVYSLSKTAPTLGTSAFIGINNNAILYYPASSEPSYDDKGWFNYFSQHIEFNGQCGDNLYWRVDDDNTLTIFGTGAMYDYDNIDNKAPWRSLNPAPKSLVLEKGIIYLGNYAFQDCSGFTEVYSLAETAPALGTDAFKNINENATLYYPSLSEQNYEVEGWFDYFSKRIGFNGKCGDNLYWNIDDENTLTIFGTGAMYDYGSSNKAPWRSLNPAPTSLVMEEGISHIGNSAFEECSRFRGSLTIPNSVTSIGAWAFYQCSGFTGSLTIPNSVTSIGRSAFRECSGFTGSLTIGNSVTTIVNSAFEECSGFTGSLTIPNSVTYIGNFAFQNCSGFTGSLTIGNSVTTIGESAFEGCSGLTGSLTIPNSVTNIGNYAFQKCSGFNGSLTIPNSVTTIGVFAFEYCSGFTGSLTIPNSVTTIGNSAFYNCYGFTGSLTIPNSVTTIGNSAFYNCYGFTEVYSLAKTAPTLQIKAFTGTNSNAILYYPASSEQSYNNKGWFNYFSKRMGFNGKCGDNLYWIVNDNTLTIFGTGAMDDYDNIDNKAPWRSLNPAPTSLVLEEGITHIGNSAFYDCKGFTSSLTIPNSVTTIGKHAFNNCSGFTGSLTIPNSVSTIGNSAFYDCKGFTSSLTIPNSVTTIGNYAFNNCSGFTGDLTIGNSVTTIGDRAFYNCSGFTGSLTIPNSVTTIGNSAFYKCSSFTGDLTIGNSVTSIGEFAFYYCKGFTGSLTIPNSVTTVGNSAFYKCSSFTGDLTIGNSVTTIGKYAFSDCSGFTGSLTIGNSVTTIGERAFYNCKGFTGSLTIPNSVTTIGEYAFYGCSGFTGDLTIGNSVTTIGKYAFSDCSGFTGSLTIPNSVTTFGYGAFYNCSGFTGSLTIPNSVTTIGYEAFYNCSGFTGDLTIPNSVTSIGNWAFQYCSGFTGDLTIPNSVTTIGYSAFYGCIGFSNIFLYRDTNPTIGENAFSSINANAKVYAPVIWEFFDNIPVDKLVKMATFVGQQTTDASTGSATINGWVGLAEGHWPDEDEHVAINAPLVLGSQQDYKTTRLQAEDDGSQQPIANSLSVKSFGLCGNENTTNGNIIIEDGGQLYCEIANGEVTVKKEILGYQQSESGSESGSESKWYTIASPLKDAIQITHDSTLLTPNSDYDLYRYDEPSYTWQNAKNSANNGFNTIDPGRGYLYANAENTTLKFKGDINTETVTYNLTAKSDVLKGFHLVGNPFTHDITFAHLNATEGASLVNGYYVLNGEGAWGATLGSNEDDVIKVGQGVLVKATAEGTLAISRQLSAISRQRSGKGQQTTDNGQQSLCISVSNAKYSDRAFVVFDKGVGLDKMNHENENIPLLYIPMEDADYAIAMMDMNVNEIPVNFETNVMGEYTISLRQENCEFDELYLLDKETDEKVNILEQDYTFIATSSENPERFILIKDNGQQTTDNRPWVYVNNGDIVIYNIEGDADIKIFDALGRCVYQGESSDETTRIANGYSSGVYMIHKIDDKGVKVQKIIL